MKAFLVIIIAIILSSNNLYSQEYSLALTRGKSMSSIHILVDDGVVFTILQDSKPLKIKGKVQEIQHNSFKVKDNFYSIEEVVKIIKISNSNIFVGSSMMTLGSIVMSGPSNVHPTFTYNGLGSTTTAQRSKNKTAPGQIMIGVGLFITGFVHTINSISQKDIKGGKWKLSVIEKE